MDATRGSNQPLSQIQSHSDASIEPRKIDLRHRKPFQSVNRVAQPIINKACPLESSQKSFKSSLTPVEGESITSIKSDGSARKEPPRIVYRKSVGNVKNAAQHMRHKEPIIQDHTKSPKEAASLAEPSPPAATLEKSNIRRDTTLVPIGKQLAQATPLHQKKIEIIDTSNRGISDQKPAEAKNQHATSQAKELFSSNLRKNLDRLTDVIEGKKLAISGEEITTVEREKNFGLGSSNIFLRSRVASKADTKTAIEKELKELIALADSCSIYGDIDQAKELQKTVLQFFDADWTKAALKNNKQFAKLAEEVKTHVDQSVRDTAKATVTNSLLDFKNSEMLENALSNEATLEEIEETLLEANKLLESAGGLDPSSTLAAAIFSDNSFQALSSFKKDIIARLTEKALLHHLDLAEKTGDVSQIEAFIESQPNKAFLHALASNHENRTFDGLGGKTCKEFIRQKIGESNVKTLLQMALDPESTDMPPFDPAIKKRMEESRQNLIGGLITQDNATHTLVASCIKTLAEQAIAKGNSNQCDTIARFCEKWIKANGQLPKFEESVGTFREIGDILKPNFGAHRTRIETALTEARAKPQPIIQSDSSQTTASILNGALQSQARYEQAISLLHSDFNALTSDIIARTPPGLFAMKPKDIESHASFKEATQFFNKTSDFVANTILKIEDPIQRQKAIEFFIDLSYSLINDQNFFGAQAVFAGLDLSSIRRLFNKESEFFISDKHKEAFNEIQKLISNDKNSARLHGAVDKAIENGKPFIPPLQLYATQRTFAHDGNTRGGNITPSEIATSSRIYDIILKSQMRIRLPLEVKSDITEKLLESSMDEKDQFARSLKLVPRADIEDIQEHGMKALSASKEAYKEFRATLSRSKEAQEFLESSPEIKKFAESIEQLAISNLSGQERQNARLEIQGKILQEIQKLIARDQSLPDAKAASKSLTALLLSFPLQRENSSAREIPFEAKKQILDQHYSPDIARIGSSAHFSALQNHAEKLIDAIFLGKTGPDVDEAKKQIVEAYLLTAAADSSRQLEITPADFLSKAPLKGLLPKELQEKVTKTLIHYAAQEHDYDLLVNLKQHSLETLQERREADDNDGMSLKSLPFHLRMDYQFKLSTVKTATHYFKTHPDVQELCKLLASALSPSDSNETTSMTSRMTLRLGMYGAVQRAIREHTSNSSVEPTPLETLINHALLEEITGNDELSPEQKNDAIFLLVEKRISTSASAALKLDTIRQEIENATKSISNLDERKKISDQLYSAAITRAAKALLSLDKNTLQATGVAGFIRASIHMAISQSTSITQEDKLNFYRHDFQERVALGTEESRKIEEVYREFNRALELKLETQPLSTTEIAHFRDEADRLALMTIYSTSASALTADRIMNALKSGIQEMSPASKLIANNIINLEAMQRLNAINARITTFFTAVIQGEDGSITKGHLGDFKLILNQLGAYTHELESIGMAEAEIQSSLDSFAASIAQFMHIANKNTAIQREIKDIQKILISQNDSKSLAAIGFSEAQIAAIKESFS